jgi:HAD superfamily hydrolase (TIGR01509 family)
MIPQPLQAVIFDMDGLLLDTEALYRTAIYGACASLRHEMTGALHLSLIGTPKDVGDANFIAYFGAAFDLDAYHRNSLTEFDALCKSGVPLRTGARSLLELLRRKNIPTGVATSTTRPRAESQLREAGISDFFWALVTRTDVNQGKPHPETFLKAAELLRVQPSGCIALEDSHNGVRAAVAAGMTTIMIPDLLEPTDEIRSLCVGILPSLLDVVSRLSCYAE